MRLIHIYLSLWCLYWLQGVLYPSGSLFSQLLLAVTLLISFYYYLVVNLKWQQPQTLKTLSLMIVVFTIYGVFAIVLGNTFTINTATSGISAVRYLKSIYISLLPVYTVYLFSKQGSLSEKAIKIWAFVFLVVAIICFYRNQNDVLNSLASRGISSEEMTNNGAYDVLGIICFIPLFKKKPVIQYGILAICLYFLLIGMKRGAAVCGLVATIVFLYDSIKSQHNTRRTIRTLLLTVGIVFFVLLSVNSMLVSSDYFNQRLESTLSGDSSERDRLYSTLFNHFINESNPFLFLFGNGADATLEIASNYAHNDWLELAINNGMIMVVIFLVFWIRVFRTINQSKNSVCKLMISLFFIIYLLKTFFSMSYADIPTCSSVALGYALANYEKDLV